VRAWFWIPEDGVAEKEHQDNVPYSQWHRDGLLRYSPGNTIRHENIRAEINDIGRVFNVVEIGVDPWQASQLERHLRDDGFDVHKVKQNYSDLSSATKHLERLILEGRLNHGGNPVMRWCATNLAVKLDQFENVIPSKAKSTQRIDGVVALIMGLARAGDAEQVVSDASELLI
jgi:phage terminase large subunit-like protein